MNRLQKTIYTGVATTTGGREGSSTSNDGKLNLTLSTPKELGGAGGNGTNPEQLFAAGYSACFIGALKHVAAQEKIILSDNVKVTAEVSIGPIEVGFGIAVKLAVSITGVDRAIAQQLIDKAHHTCPYSNATRGNIEVVTELVE
jgi:Ohr subfamily peroxiredoxin